MAGGYHGTLQKTSVQCRKPCDADVYPWSISPNKPLKRDAPRAARLLAVALGIQMNRHATRWLIALSATALVLVGVYGTVHRTQNNLSNELMAFGFFALLFLWPFWVFGSRASDRKIPNVISAIAAMTMACLGIYFFIGDMVLSHDPSWGLSFGVVPIINTVIYAVASPFTKPSRE